jgi:tRNA pseudouridine55 synthase
MLEGVFNIDKPAGMTSHDVVNDVRRIIGIRRVGHTGTLDPLATGVLLICVGRATRLAEYLTGQDKRYTATIRLGMATDTYDAEGEIVSEHLVTVTQDEINRALETFRGAISQKAPRYSAIKVGGEALYKKSRRGETPERPVREVTVYELEILEWDSPFLKIDLTCSSGTYVRSIAHDLGQLLGCGGYLKQLRRSSIGDFSIREAVALNGLDHDNLEEHLMPMDVAIKHMPKATVSIDEARKLYHGQSIPIRDNRDENDLIRVYDDQSHFVGIVTYTDGHFQAKKIFYKDWQQSD